MSKINRISNRLNNKLNNLFKKVINERRLLTEGKACNNDWDCGDGKWCGPNPPCDAPVCAWGSRGQCVCIRTDCVGPEMVTDFEDIEVGDEEVINTLREEVRLLTEMKTCWVGSGKGRNRHCQPCDGNADDSTNRKKRCNNKIADQGCNTYNECMDGRAGYTPTTGNPNDIDIEMYFADRLSEDIVTTTIPSLKTDEDGYVYIDNKKYELQTEKGAFGIYTRIGIDVISASVDENGTLTLVAKHPLGGNIESKISDKNFETVITGVNNNAEEITVTNKKGKEFFLVKA